MSLGDTPNRWRLSYGFWKRRVGKDPGRWPAESGRAVLLRCVRAGV